MVLVQVKMSNKYKTSKGDKTFLEQNVGMEQYLGPRILERNDAVNTRVSASQDSRIPTNRVTRREFPTRGRQN